MQGGSVVEWGEWLVARLDESDAALSGWLDELAAFDVAQGWAADGQVSCVDWLMWRARLSRSTAYERLQVARALQDRPALHDAFGSGLISYSAVRAIARLDGPDPEVDAAFIELAASAPVRDVERMVAIYGRHADQERPVDDENLPRGIRTRPNYDGTTTLEFTVADIEAADALATLDAFMAYADRQREEAGEQLALDGDEPASESAGQSARADIKPWSQRRADAFMDMCRTAIKHLDDGRACGDDRFLVHIVATAEGMTLLDGTPLDDATAARLVEDSSATTLLLGPGYEPLAMGRKTREWTVHQRRAVVIRDGGQCRFPGCRRRRYLHTHHHRWWRHGGPTDVANGFLECRHHHALIHNEGWQVEGEANRTLTFHRPDGSTLGDTTSSLARIPT